MQGTMSKQATQVRESAIVCVSKAKVWVDKVKEASFKTAKDRKVQVTVASAAGGTVAMGVCGAALGGVVGIPFALFTFGLSIPLSATIGAAVGGTAGAATGGAVGFTVFSWRTEIAKFASNGWSRIKASTTSTKMHLTVKTRETYSIVSTSLFAWKDFVTVKARTGAMATKQKVLDLSNSSVKLAQEPRVQVTAASATVSGVAVGAGGGAVGLATGGIVGAAVGVVPAIFTFGLSIPMGAMIGSGAGFCLGSAVGGTTGVIGGGAVGYGVYGKKTEIRAGLHKCASYVKAKKDHFFGSSKPLTKTVAKDDSPKKVRPEVVRT